MQRAHERGRQEHESEVRELQELIQGTEQQLREKDASVVASQQENQRLTRDNQQLTHHIQRLTRDLRDRDQQIEERERQLRDNERINAECQQTLLQKEKVLSGTIEVHQQTRPEASNPAKDSAIRVSWKECPEAPCQMYGEQAVTDGNAAYFSESGYVYTYDSKGEKWRELPECPQKYGSLAIV